MSDRGIIKWRPFNSVSDGDSIIKTLEHQRNKIDKPILSSDQIDYLNEKLLECFHAKTITTVKYYNNGYINTRFGVINSIDQIKRKIIINGYTIYIDQILDINS